MCTAIVADVGRVCPPIESSILSPGFRVQDFPVFLVCTVIAADSERVCTPSASGVEGSGFRIET